MATCYEVLQSTISGTFQKYQTVLPVPVEPALCDTASPANPWGMPVTGHFLGFSSSDYTKLMSEPTLMDIFTIPLAGDLQQMWMLGFSLPIITYLTTWGYGVVINWFNEKYHR